MSQHGLERSGSARPGHCRANGGRPWAAPHLVLHLTPFGHGSIVIVQVIVLVARVRASAHEQGIGLDVSQHGEEAYSRGEGAILILPEGGTVDEVSGRYRTA